MIAFVFLFLFIHVIPQAEPVTVKTPDGKTLTLPVVMHGRCQVPANYGSRQAQKDHEATGKVYGVMVAEIHPRSTTPHSRLVFMCRAHAKDYLKVDPGP